MGTTLTHSQSSGGQVRTPCPFAVLSTDDLESRIAISLPPDPELGRGEEFREMQQLGIPAEVQEHANLHGLPPSATSKISRLSAK